VNRALRKFGWSERVEVEAPDRGAAIVSRHRAAGLLVGLLATAVFIPAFSAAFLWDDSIISEFHNQVSGFSDIWLNPSYIESEGHYWPLVYTTFWIEHLIWGLNPVGYHVVNVLLHAANSVFVFTLLRRLNMPGAWFAAALFAVHPTHVDSVAWAIERKDVLSAFFYLLSLLAYLRWDTIRNGSDSGALQPTTLKHRHRSDARRGATLYALSLVAFTLALLSKSIVVTLPIILLIYHWWRNGRLSRRDLVGTLPHFAVAAIVTVGDLVYYLGRESDLMNITVVERMQIMARSTWHYVSKLFWPADLLPIYPSWDISGSDPRGWAITGGIIAVVVGLWMLRHRIGRAPLAGVLFFGVTIAPVSGIIDYGYMNTSYVADRFQYIAGLGLIAVVAGSATFLVNNIPTEHWLNKTRLLACAGMLLLAGLSILTWRQALIYESSERFFTYVVTNNPTARGGAYTNLGNAYRSDGRLEEAIAAYEQSLVNDAPYVTLPLSNLGVTYAELEESDTAESYFRQAIASDPSFVPAISNLTTILLNNNELDAAHTLVQDMLSLKPRWAIVQHNAALLYQEMGDFLQAEEHFRRGLELHPSDEGLLSSYGIFLVNQELPAEAEPILRNALQKDPMREDVAQSLATALIMQGRDNEAAELVEDGFIESLGPSVAVSEVERGNLLLDESRYDLAREAYEAAIAADSENLAAHVQLGVALENLDEDLEALESYRNAYNINNEDISAVYFFALLSARLEQNDEALELFDEAIELFAQGLVPLHSDDAELPDLADVYVNRSVVNVGLGRLNEAVADTERALELDPTRELAARNREQILGMLAQQQNAG